MDRNNVILHMKDISKSFGSVQVLFNVALSLHEGEVKGLIGENGAGKSTLMKILTGEYQKDSGRISLFGEPVDVLTPGIALQKGIAMVYQELNNAQDMTIAENMFIGREIKKYGWRDKKEMNRKTAEYLRALDLSFSPEEKMRNLTVSEMQMVEIAKVVSYGSRIIVLDEPTSSITQDGVEKLFQVVRKLKGMGIGIIYISHKLEELFELTDSIVIMRDGHIVREDATGNLTQDELIRLMVGREIEDVFPEKNTEFGEVVLKVEDFSRGEEFQNISFEVRAGEVVAFSGLVGAGRTEVMMALFGDQRAAKGTVRIHNRETVIRSPRAAVAKKMALIPEDRKRHGLNLSGTVEDNMMMVVEKETGRGKLFLDRKRRRKLGSEMIKSLNVRCNGLGQRVASLSGGNQQKIVLAKWLLSDSDIYILDEPTRGIDIGAKIEIYRLIHRLAEQGKAIVLISSELNEIIGLSNKVIVMYEGRVTGEVSGDEIDQERIMSFAHAYDKEVGS